MPRTTAPHSPADWQARADASLSGIAGAAPSVVEEALDSLLAEARRDRLDAVPIAALTEAAVACLDPATSDDPAYARLMRRRDFATEIEAAAPRIEETYADRIATASGGRAGWRGSVVEQAFRLGRRDGYDAPAADAYHAALLSWLLMNGQDCAPRPVVSARRLAALHAERMRAPSPEIVPTSRTGAAIPWRSQSPTTRR